MTDRICCPTCQRRSIRVQAGKLVPHTRRTGRKGGQCPQSNRELAGKAA